MERREPGDVELTRASVVSRSPDLMAAEVGGDLVLMSIERGSYFALDPVGAAVWRRLESPVAVDAICAALTAEYDVSPEACAADVLRFLHDLHASGLLVVAGVDGT